MRTMDPEEFMRFFEKNCDESFVDTHTGRPALDVWQEEKSDYDRWLEVQDETMQREHKMGAL